jgi:hypothetical protein
VAGRPALLSPDLCQLIQASRISRRQVFAPSPSTGDRRGDGRLDPSPAKMAVYAVYRIHEAARQFRNSRRKHLRRRTPGIYQVVEHDAGLPVAVALA